MSRDDLEEQATDDAWEQRAPRSTDPRYVEKYDAGVRWTERHAPTRLRCSPPPERS